jgi:hypothetical protein
MEDRRLSGNVNPALLVVPLLYAVVAAAQAAEPVPLESLAAPLLKARTYCETGKWGTRFQADPSFQETHYRVCAHSDGRFKYVENPGRPGQLEIWSDGQKLHRYVEYGRAYQQYQLSERAHAYERPREMVPALHSRLFRWATRSPAGLDLLGSLRGYRVNDELSDPKHTVYERWDDDRRGGARIRVATADRAIVRYENWYDGTLRGYIEITAREVNQPVADSELGREVPLTARYSPGNNLPVFVAGLFVAVAIAGLVFWTWLFARAESPEGVVSVRRRLWRIFSWAIAVVATLLGLLTAATWGGGGGHPPAIAYVMVMVMLAAIAFGLVACFLLTSYVGQALSGPLARKRRR